MRGVSFKAVALATIATLGLDIVSGIVLIAARGGDPFFAPATDQQREMAIAVLMADPTFLVLSLVLGTLTTVIGGYLAARIARIVPYMNALAFGLLGIVIGAFMAEGVPLWYNVLGFSAMLPAALFGGHLAKNTQDKA